MLRHKTSDLTTIQRPIIRQSANSNEDPKNRFALGHDLLFLVSNERWHRDSGCGSL